MKRFVLLLITAIFANLSFAQVSEVTYAMSQGSQNTLTIEIPGASKKDVEKTWQKFMKDYKGKTKKDKKAKLIFSDNAKIGDMSSNTVDVYAKVEEKGDNSQLYVAFDLGGAFLSSGSHPDKFDAGDKMLNAFALHVKRNQVKDELKGEEKSLGKLEGDLKNLVKKKGNLEDDIKKYEEKIIQAKKDIEQNIEDQKNKQTEIEGQQKVVGEVKQRLDDLK